LERKAVSGVGDLYFRGKLNLIGPEGGDVQAAIIPYVKAPNGCPESQQGVEEGAIAPISFALPRAFTLCSIRRSTYCATPMISGDITNIQFLATRSHAVTDSVTGYVELWGQANNDPVNPNKQASLDLSYMARLEKIPSLQSIRANIGLTAATPNCSFIWASRSAFDAQHRPSPLKFAALQKTTRQKHSRHSCARSILAEAGAPDETNLKKARPRGPGLPLINSGRDCPGL